MPGKTHKNGQTWPLTDAEVIAEIRQTHLKANIDVYESDPSCRIQWSEARVDPGGSVFGEGPYVKVPVTQGNGERTVHRVYAPARLQRRLAQRWGKAKT